MLKLGYLLLIIGFLGATYFASLDPIAIPWLYFVPMIGLGIAGVIMIRVARGSSAKAEHVLAGNREVLEKSLQQIVQRLDDLRQRKVEIPTYEMRFEIDRLFRDDLRRFADARESLTHLYGLQAYADVMSAFAAGERYLNRIWSASTDGYQDEVLSYVDRANTQFIQARDKLAAVMAAGR
ncbi:MAG: hypothetical protein Tsb002_34950 [Wenzhouxiangellaceae bacterium]